MKAQPYTVVAARSFAWLIFRGKLDSIVEIENMLTRPWLFEKGWREEAECFEPSTMDEK